MNTFTIETPNNQKTVLLNSQYEVGDYIAEGAFGKVYKGFDVRFRRPVAIKEDISGKSWMFDDEYTIYHNLGKMYGFLEKLGYFSTRENKKYLVFTLIDRDLETIMDDQPGQKLDLKSTLMIGIQTIERIQILHKKGYVHRDIKPENIGMGLGDEASLMYLLDLGNCAEYLTPKKREHVKLKKTKNSKLIGSVRYASLNSHEGLELSRRDDIESLAYSLIFLMRGHLPWEGYEFNSDTLRSRQDKVKDKKTKLSPDELCQDLDPVFEDLLVYARSLEYKAEPDYDYMTDLLDTALKRNGLTNDSIFAWQKVSNTVMTASIVEKSEEVAKERETLVETKESIQQIVIEKDQNLHQERELAGQENESVNLNHRKKRKAGANRVNSPIVNKKLRMAPPSKLILPTHHKMELRSRKKRF